MNGRISPMARMFANTATATATAANSNNKQRQRQFLVVAAATTFAPVPAIQSPLLRGNSLLFAKFASPRGVQRLSGALTAADQ
jgi:hypothetical protein